MLFLICLVVGCATGLVIGRFVYSRFPLWPQVATAVVGAMVGGFAVQMIDGLHATGALTVLAALFGAVGALALASSIRQPVAFR